ncbi:hypothetical protein D3C87_157440 [compost metagenome]
MTITKIIELLTLFSPTILAIGICVGLYFYKSLNTIHKSIFFYLLLMLVIDISGRVLKFVYGNNLILLPIYSLLELGVFVFFYYKFLFKAKHRLILGLSIIAILYILWEIIVLKEMETRQFQSYAKVIDNFVIITLALGFFHEKINIFKESKWDNFRLNTIILIFFSINMLFFLPINFLINESTGLKFYFWLSNLVITILFYLFLITSIWKNGRIRK